nr:RNA-directed DNA polymerase, eukaryota [Tanacetum cinerariifolium]
MGSHHLHANVARFMRPPAVKSGEYTHQNEVCEPALLLDESCLNQLDYLLGLLSKVKEFSSFDNMRMILGNKGFNDIDLRYMGEDEQSIGFIKEDFDGSDVEKEGDNNVSMVPDSVKEDVNVQAEEKGNDFDVNNSLNPFELYLILNKKKIMEEKMDKSNRTVSIPFPPGFTPSDETEVECDKKSMGNNEGSVFGNEKGESVSSGSRKSNKIDIQRTGGSLLTVMEELIKGNYAFEYVYSPAVGNSGGILCVWEKSAFKKNNSTIFDYFVMIGGSWLCSGVNILIISVYAPQEYIEKKMLWDYLVHVICKWDGEVIVIGDFNEEDNSESEDEQSIGFIKEDFNGSDVEKEGDNNVSMVVDSVKEDVNVQAEEKGNDFDVNNSLDPFELYPILNKKKIVDEKMDKLNRTVSIPFPPGFTPSDETEVECDKKSMGNNEGSGFGNEKEESVSIWSKGDLGIFGDGEVAIIGDLLYGIRVCGIPCRRANVEYAGLVIELYVGRYEVKVMNLF